MGKINAYADSPVQNIWQTIQNQKKKKKNREDQETLVSAFEQFLPLIDYYQAVSSTNFQVFLSIFNMPAILSCLVTRETTCVQGFILDSKIEFFLYYFTEMVSMVSERTLGNIH